MRGEMWRTRWVWKKTEEVMIRITTDPSSKERA
jgi:hypothetical protein